MVSHWVVGMVVLMDVSSAACSVDVMGAMLVAATDVSTVVH